MDTVDLIIRYECGELVFSEQVQLFAELIKSGHVWNLQGSYGRMARHYIDADLISTKGVVNNQTLRLYVDDETLKQQ